MLSLEEKIVYFEKKLNKIEGNYYDIFKQDIIIFIDEFNSENKKLHFLNNINSFEEINIWTERLTSKIILKFDSESEQINDFIYDFLENENL